MNVNIRTFNPDNKDEAAELFAIFVEAVRDGTKDHYTSPQRRAWAPRTDMPEGWPDQLVRLETWVAEVDGQIAGFMAATPKGHIDLAFVRPRWMGRGVARALYERILERAQARGLTRLTTHASHPARPFFARQGWQVETLEKIDRNGEVLERFAMSLELKETTDECTNRSGR